MLLPLDCKVIRYAFRRFLKLPKLTDVGNGEGPSSDSSQISLYKRSPLPKIEFTWVVNRSDNSSTDWPWVLLLNNVVMAIGINDVRYFVLYINNMRFFNITVYTVRIFSSVNVCFVCFGGSSVALL